MKVTSWWQRRWTTGPEQWVQGVKAAGLPLAGGQPD